MGDSTCGIQQTKRPPAWRSFYILYTCVHVIIWKIKITTNPKYTHKPMNMGRDIVFSSAFSWISVCILSGLVICIHNPFGEFVFLPTQITYYPGRTYAENNYCWNKGDYWQNENFRFRFICPGSINSIWHYYPISVWNNFAYGTMTDFFQVRYRHAAFRKLLARSCHCRQPSKKASLIAGGFCYCLVIRYRCHLDISVTIMWDIRITTSKFRSISGFL